MLPLVEVPDDDDQVDVARTLFRRFNEARIQYCHFKSNAFLHESLAGRTDLDVLVDRCQAARAAEILRAIGFRLFRSAFLTRYPSVEDYLACDTRTGRLIHLHLHYRLVVGARFLKAHELPCDTAVLHGRAADPATGVFTSSPAHELFLLLVRAALKVTWFEWLQGLLGRSCIRGRTRQEFKWLFERTDAREVQAIASDELGPDAAAMVPELLAGPPSVFQLRAFRRRARGALALSRRHGSVEGAIVQAAARLMSLMTRLNRRLLHQPRPFRRTPHPGGISIAFLGTHGAGKSTVTREIERWFDQKVDVYRVYFGSGAGTSSLLRWPIKVLAKLHHRVRRKRTRRLVDRRSDGFRSLSGESGWMVWARVVWALALALEKRTKLQRSLRARRRGMIVICDRYPQNQVQGYNDGPLLGAWLDSSSRIRRTLARFEGRIYYRAVSVAPDLIIKLDVAPEVAVRRRPEETLDELNRRREAVRRIDYGSRCRYVEIDASEPIDDVLLSVKRAIWSVL